MTADQSPALQGLRILIAEDNMLAAMELEQILKNCGCVPVGPAATVAQAMRMVQCERLDGAVLDINLREQMVFPVAEELARRSVPMIFATGYEGSSILPAQLADRPLLRKPYPDHQLVRLLAAIFVSG